ncbi:MAG: DUF2490 domain-containing protein [Bacteroidetes bacterium]|nr:DUF2490 domain-containing protein [Bacteroidota bacterium]
MSNPKGTIFLIGILLFVVKAFPQVNDAGTWLSVNLSKDFSQAVGLNFSQEVRIMENYSEVMTIFSDLGLEYRFNKHLKASLNYRFLNDKRLDDTYSGKNRFYMDLSYRQKVKPFLVTVRERFQSQFSEPYSSGDNNPELTARTKAALKLDLKFKVSPYISFEGFTPLNTPGSRLLPKTRYACGMEYDFAPRQMLDLSFLVQSSNSSVPARDYVVCLGYSLKL